MKTVRILMVSTILVMLLCVGSSASDAQPAEQSTIYFLHQSNACHCIDVACQAAQPLADKIEGALAQGITLKRLDYAKQPEQVDALTSRYKLFTFPAVLAVGADGAELYKAQGRLDNELVFGELEQLGLVLNKPD
ncbi:MAG: hypothetical protein P9M14_13380 [Candidatus Alcyoniella australis]|nr:hypothetical protein [Candidatus Alcyoniella australis]